MEVFVETKRAGQTKTTLVTRSIDDNTRSHEAAMAQARAIDERAVGVLPAPLIPEDLEDGALVAWTDDAGEESLQQHRPIAGGVLLHRAYRLTGTGGDTRWWGSMGRLMEAAVEAAWDIDWDGRTVSAIDGGQIEVLDAENVWWPERPHQ